MFPETESEATSGKSDARLTWLSVVLSIAFQAGQRLAVTVKALRRY